jgi:hypothetical protein
MNLKQKISIAAAGLLPILALTAFFLVGSPKADAQSCPGGMFRAPCGVGGTGCANGAGGCVANGGSSAFIFCPPHQGPGGPGTCSNGTVCCTQ